MLKIAYSSAITLAAILKTRSARRLARCLLPAFLCAHIFIKRETSGYEAGSVHGLGKWCAKLRTGKFRPGIAFTICKNQFHLVENDGEHKFPLGILRLEKQDYLFSCSVAPGNFPMERPKKSCSYLAEHHG